VSGQLYAVTTSTPGDKAYVIHRTGVGVDTRDILDMVTKRKIPVPLQEIVSEPSWLSLCM